MLLQGVRCRRSHPFTVLRDAHSSPTKPYIAPFSTSPNLMIREITNPNLISTRVSSRRRQSPPPINGRRSDDCAYQGFLPDLDHHLIQSCGTHRDIRSGNFTLSLLLLVSTRRSGVSACRNMGGLRYHCGKKVSDGARTGI
jgi:hypothetical protein